MLRRALCASVVLVTWCSVVTADPRPIDAPPQHGNQDVQFALVNIKTGELNEVNSALLRLKEGNYGNCECGNEISEIRLRERPSATKCLDCQTADEMTASKSFRREMRQSRIPTR